MPRGSDQEGATLEELERVYEQRLTSLRRLAEAVVGDRDQALDVVQEGFARAVRLRGSFRRSGTLDSWVWRIVLNSARDHVAARAQRRRAVVIQPAGGECGAEAADRVRVAVAALPERQRLVLFLRYFADLEYGAIAEVLAISPGTVGATLNAAHARVRQLLEEVA